jgi:hypothetical protein
MRLRMPVGRCCCEEQSFTIESGGLASSVHKFIWWTSGGGEHDPVTMDLSVHPFFTYANLFRKINGIRAARTGGIPERVYTSVTMRLWGFSQQGNGLADVTNDHEPKIYHIYTVNRVLDNSGFAVLFGEGGVDRSELNGPVVWDESASDWRTAAYRTSPNIASIVNPVLALPGWDTTSQLHFVFNAVGQEPSGSANPPGRTVIPETGGSRLTFTW